MTTDWLHCPMSYAVYKFQPEIGSFSACCDANGYDFDLKTFQELGNDYFEKHPMLIQRKTSLFNSKRHSDCSQCWQKEDMGLSSMRQEQGSEYNTLFNNHHLEFDTAYPGRFELWMNSTCNLGCFMCHLGNSNTLRKIWKTDKDIRGYDGIGYDLSLMKSDFGKHNQHGLFVDAMLAFITKHLREVKLYDLTVAYLGGEPTLHSEMYEHADLFIEAGRQAILDGKRLTIEITTNGTSKDKLNERFYKMFEKYKSAGWRVTMKLSQDSAGEFAQVRHGSDFEQIKRNFGNWINKDSAVDKVDSFTVVSGINLPYIDTMAEYIEDVVNSHYSGTTKLAIHFNALIDPEWMQVKYLPKHFVTQPFNKADAIFTALSDTHPDIYYNQSLFRNITGTTIATVAPEDAAFFFEKLDYINTVYKKTYPNWNFFETFPHLNEYATEYGIIV